MAKMFLISKNYDLNKQVKNYMQGTTNRILGSGIPISSTSYNTWLSNINKIDTEVVRIGSTEKNYYYLRLYKDPELIDIQVGLVLEGQNLHFKLETQLDLFNSNMRAPFDPILQPIVQLKPKEVKDFKILIKSCNVEV